MLGPRRTVTVLSAGLAVTLLAAHPARAASVVDQSTLGGTVASGWVVISSTQQVGGTFTAGITGGLDRLDVTAQKIGSPTNLTASIYVTDGSGFPTGSALATTPVDFSSLPANPSYATVSISFASPARVIAGTRYAYVLSSTDSGGAAFAQKYTTTTYPGVNFIADGTGSWATLGDSPLFATYVTADSDAGEPAVPLQQFAVSAGTQARDCQALSPSHASWPGLAGQGADGWSISYAHWPHDGRGGWVCSRQPARSGSTWVFR